MTLERKLEVVKAFEQGVELYKARKFEEALAHFKRGLVADPNDGPTKLYIERCEDFIQNPPPEQWNGVFVMKTK